MTENPINPAALYDYAASKNDMDSLRPEERTFLEACAWEWERLIDHGAEEWGKQFEALGIKPGVPQAPSAKPTPAAPEKPAPSSPAAERADEGLEEEAERLREAYTNDEGSWLEWPDCRQEPWLRVARAARALRRGGVTEEPWGIVDDLALSGKVTDTMTAGQPARSRLRNELSAAVRERDQLAAKLAEAERALCERAEQVDKLMQERDLVMARLGNFCQPGEIEDRIRILQGHAGKMERQRDEARAEAERLRSMSTVEMMGENLNVKHHVEEWEARCLKAEADADRLRSERALIAKALDAEFSSEPLWSVAERLRGERDRLLGARLAEKEAPFVVDIPKVREAAWKASGSLLSDKSADAAITEIERQRAEHAAKGGAS